MENIKKGDLVTGTNKFTEQKIEGIFQEECKECHVIKITNPNIIYDFGILATNNKNEALVLCKKEETRQLEGKK